MSEEFFEDKNGCIEGPDNDGEFDMDIPEYFDEAGGRVTTCYISQDALKWMWERRKTPNTKEALQNDTQHLQDSISLLETVKDYLLNGSSKHYDIDCADRDVCAALAKLKSMQ